VRRQIAGASTDAARSLDGSERQAEEGSYGKRFANRAIEGLDFTLHIKL
jgi:hypothetical protein